MIFFCFFVSKFLYKKLAVDLWFVLLLVTPGYYDFIR